MTYSHFQHRHNFAVWCAARAVQRRFTKTPILKKALEESGVVAFVKQNDGVPLAVTDYDKHHEQWCESILETWQLNKINGASYGRAAKLIAIYIKSMLVVQCDLGQCANVAHPPIDRILLQNIAKDKNINHPHKAEWRRINWTQLDKSRYQQLIADFRQICDGKPFWSLEKYWIVTDID